MRFGAGAADSPSQSHSEDGLEANIDPTRRSLDRAEAGPSPQGLGEPVLARKTLGRGNEVSRHRAHHSLTTTGTSAPYW